MDARTEVPPAQSLSTDYVDADNQFHNDEDSLCLLGGPAGVDVTWFAAWACEPKDLDAALASLSRHVPGVRLSRAWHDGQTVTGLTLADVPEAAHRHEDVRLAVGFACCGHVPPSALVLKALLTQPPEGLMDDPEIRAARARSLDRMDERLSRAKDALAAASPAPSP